ncbi:hypothetical protein Zmor_008068 [Zophobas morio]|uniref:CRAL-TRIO domain-containing protein n=2 Tax=Zophobas morio TaxID=2755281 RepID=A0AA38MQ19_9CUCU|nr:hypothetical protein Zmor_008068 [Zophobas morio]
MGPIIRDIDEIYAKDKRIKREDVRILKEWLQKQEHLPQMTETQIIIFLHTCFYSIEQAKANIESFWTKRTLYYYCFKPLDKEELRTNSSVAFIGVLPKPTPQGYNILLSKLIDVTPEKFDFTKLTRMVDMVAALYLNERGPLDGVVIVYDAKGCTFGHLTRINLDVMKHSTEIIRESIPVRIKQIHLINAFSLVDKLMGLLKPFLTNELYSLINVHSSLSTFYKYVPQECLPEEYGGDLPSCQILQKDNLNHMLSSYPFYEWHDSLLVDESKRLEKSTSFGIDGTFKTLEID